MIMTKRKNPDEIIAEWINERPYRVRLAGGYWRCYMTYESAVTGAACDSQASAIDYAGSTLIGSRSEILAEYRRLVKNNEEANHDVPPFSAQD